ncbi:hypothetical protein Tco_0221234 [Tanacetum coccineum]
MILLRLIDDSIFFDDIDYVEHSPPILRSSVLEEVKDFSQEKSSGSTTILSDYSLPDYEAFYLDDDHIEEKGCGFKLPLLHLFSQYDSFIFDLSINPFPPADRSNFYHEEFAGELAHIISPSEYDHFYFKIEPELWMWWRIFLIIRQGKFSFPSGTRNKIFDLGIFIGVQSKIFISWDAFSISFIRDPLFLVIDTLLPFSSKNEDKVSCVWYSCAGERGGGGILLTFSHRGLKALNESPMMIYGGDIPILDVPFLHFYPP